MIKYTLLFLFLTNLLNSQSINTLGKDYAVIKKLESQIKETNSDSVKSFKHLKLSTIYFKNYDLDNYRYHLAKGKLFAKGSPFLKVNVLYYESLIYLHQEDYEAFNTSVLKILTQLKPYENKVSYELQLIIIQNVSSYFGNTFELDKSIDILLREGIPLAKKTKNYLMLGSFNQSIANSFSSLGDFNKARPYFKEAIIQMKKVDNFGLDVLSSCYIDYANCLIKLNDLSEASNVLTNVTKTLAQNDNNNLYPKYYSTLGYLLQMKNQHYKAIQQFEKGLTYYYTNPNYSRRDISYGLLVLGLAKSKSEVKDYKTSTAILDSLNLNSSEHRLLKYELLHQNLTQLGDHQKANHFLEKFILLKDSLENESKEKEYRDLEAKYNTSEKERKILKLESEKRDKEVRLKNLRFWYAFVSVSLFILVILTYFLYRNFKIQKKLNEQQEIIHLQNIEFLRSKKEIEIMQAMIEGEESERKRISRDLHDGIGSRLSSLKMQIQQIDLTNYNFADYEKFLSNLNLAIKDLRQTAFNLVPETLAKLGLDMALNDLCFVMSNSMVQIHYSSSSIRSTILSSHQVTIFRIVQELINNALKHSNCSEIVIDCIQNKELFLITVEDNGIGFNTSDLNCFTGLGLKNIKNRVELLNGNLEIKSTISKGTVFNIELKVKLEDEK